MIVDRTRTLFKQKSNFPKSLMFNSETQSLSSSLYAMLMKTSKLKKIDFLSYNYNSINIKFLFRAFSGFNTADSK